MQLLIKPVVVIIVIDDTFLALGSVNSTLFHCFIFVTSIPALVLVWMRAPAIIISFLLAEIHMQWVSDGNTCSRLTSAQTVRQEHILLVKTMHRHVQQPVNSFRIVSGLCSVISSCTKYRPWSTFRLGYLLKLIISILLCVLNRGDISAFRVC